MTIPVVVRNAVEQQLSRPWDEVAVDLERYASALLKWNDTHNLVSRETVHDLWGRHIADCLQLVRWVRPHAGSAMDFGSGGGLPGLVLAIALKGRLAVTLVESVGRKAAFLRHVNRELKLEARVIDARVESLDSRETPPELITARAVAPLDVLLDLSRAHWRVDTHALFPKGREHVEELQKATDRWDFDVTIHPSLTNTSAAILEIQNLREKSGA